MDTGPELTTVQALTKETFETFIQQPFVIVDFWASWCGPCRALAPVLETVAQTEKVPIGKMNIESEDSQAFVQQYNIRSIPTLLFFQKGECRETHVGLISEPDLVKKIKPYVQQ